MILNSSFWSCLALVYNLKAEHCLHMTLCIQKPPVVKEEDEPEEEEEDELGHAETYAEYMPQKCKYYCFKSKNQYHQ